jgi:demethoxyubiquinone hydroxylase (CLK1/Coq7/Cat5 family)
MRCLWFITGFLLGVVTTALGLLWLMARAVVG